MTRGLLAGRFLIEGEPLGHGPTGTVYPAFDEVTGRRVAAKVVHAELLEQPETLLRLRQEVAAASRIRHAGLVVVIGLFKHEATQVLVTERLHGPSLDQPGHTPMTTAGALELALQVTDALAALHAHGRVHGDLRPSHLVLADRGVVLLGLGQGGVGDVVVAKPGQTAPEVMQGAPPGVPADLYGLGVVLHFALTGRMPFSGRTPWAVIGQQQQAAPGIIPGPTGLAHFVQTLLQPEPDRRPRSAEEVRRALLRLRDNPAKRVGPGLRAAIVLGPSWTVHGRDPATGGPAWMARQLPRRQARALVHRLNGSGWEVRADAEGLGLVDLAWITATVVLLGLFLPVLGGLVGGYLVLRWRASKLRPGLSRALPKARTRLPPAPSRLDLWLALAAAGALVLGAVGLATWPPLAIPAGIVLIGAIVAAWRTHQEDEAALARRARIQTALADARHALAHRVLPLDEALGLQGELEALEGGWRSGAIADDRLRDSAEDLRSRLLGAPPAESEVPGALREAMRRTREELDDDSS